jgi:hypothetical protein
VKNIQKHITIVVVIFVFISGTIFKKDMTIHPQSCRKCCCLAGVIGLRRALGHYKISTLGLSLCHQKL